MKTFSFPLLVDDELSGAEGLTWRVLFFSLYILMASHLPAQLTARPLICHVIIRNPSATAQRQRYSVTCRLRQARDAYWPCYQPYEVAWCRRLPQVKDRVNGCLALVKPRKLSPRAAYSRQYVDSSPTLPPPVEASFDDVEDSRLSEVRTLPFPSGEWSGRERYSADAFPRNVVRKES